MTSSWTPNKYLEKPGNGDYVDTWNIPVNGDMTNIDAALGGVTNLNATSGNATLSSNVLVTANYINSSLNITGAMTANVTYTIPSGVGGTWIVRNATTDSVGGPWTVTIASGGGGTSVVVLRGKSAMVWSDGTNIRDVNENVQTIGTVTSVDVSGGTTGLTTTGGPVTTNGTITIGGTLAANSGGTGLSSFSGANLALYTSSNSTVTSGTLPITAGGTGITSFGTGVQTALGANVTGSGGIVLSNAATITNATISVSGIANATISNSTLVTSALGTPTSGNLVNTTAIPVANATGTLVVANGGTGATTLTANNVVLGNGTSAVQFVSPSTDGNILSSDGTTWSSATRLYRSTAKASTSGTSIDFTSIPSWVKRITISMSGVSTSGGSRVIVQVGSGSFSTSGYLCFTSYIGTSGNNGSTVTNGLSIWVLDSSSSVRNGIITFVNLSGNIWVGTAMVSSTSGSSSIGMSTATITLSGTLDRFRVTTDNGTDTFDAGSINYFYE